MADKPIISRLENLMARLMAEHERVSALERQARGELAALKTENRALQERLVEAERALQVARLGQGLAGGQQEGRSKALVRVNALVREVDKCIALLDAAAALRKEDAGTVLKREEDGATGDTP